MTARRLHSIGWMVCLCLALCGCQAFFAPVDPLPITVPEPPPDSQVPRELAKVSLPTYVIEPPDILLVEALKIVPKGPYIIEPLDTIAIQVLGTLLDQPIAAAYSVDLEGKVDLGPSYGRVKLSGLTIDEAKAAIFKHLRQILQEPQVSVFLLSSVGAQPVTGQHLVGPDGRLNLGTYGSVYVAGLTVPEAKRAVEERLSKSLESPEVFLSVLAYNSKVYYVITAGAGNGDNVLRVPVTGNETVLDAVSTVGGLSQLSSKKLWISRPAPNGVGCEQILPVNWNEITRGASTATNYQLMPGDRLFIEEDTLIAIDAMVTKATRPFERIFGFNILGTQMISRFKTVGTPSGRF